MLFYLKRSPLLELAGAVVLAAAAWLLIRWAGAEVSIAWTPRALAVGLLGFLGLGVWTFGIQLGYRIARGKRYAEALTQSLARFYAHASAVQVLLAGAAAAGEESFFRGFLQTRFGLMAGALGFMAGHLGGKDIRVIGYWSIFQGLGLGLCYAVGQSLVAPMLAHALFDIGAMLYFRWLMRGQPEPVP